MNPVQRGILPEIIVQRDNRANIQLPHGRGFGRIEKSKEGPVKASK